MQVPGPAHHGSRNSFMQRSQFLLRARMFSCSRFSFHQGPTYSFHRHTGLLFLWCLPHQAVGSRKAKSVSGVAQALMRPPPGSPHRCLASSRACPSPCQHRRLQLSGVWGLQQHHRGSSATTGAREPEAGPPTCCLTCFWPAWWRRGLCRAGCARGPHQDQATRCKQSHFRR